MFNQPASREFRRFYRAAIGRTDGSVSYIRADTARMETALTRSVDPILLLAGARRYARSTGYGAQNYGELLQAVVSPVHLPDMRRQPEARA